MDGRACEHCGKNFIPTHPRQRFCSEKHRKAAEDKRRKTAAPKESRDKPAAPAPVPPPEKPKTPPIQPKLAFPVIEGGSGSTMPEPDWASIFDDELDQQAAREFWRGALLDLRDNEKLAGVNAHQIKRLVISYVMHDLAARRVIEQGAVIKAKRSAVPQYNPWWSILKDSNAMATTHEAELTLSPRRRNNGGKVKKQATKGALPGASYLKPVPK